VIFRRLMWYGLPPTQYGIGAVWHGSLPPAALLPPQCARPLRLLAPKPAEGPTTPRGTIQAAGCPLKRRRAEAQRRYTAKRRKEAAELGAPRFRAALGGNFWALAVCSRELDLSLWLLLSPAFLFSGKKESKHESIGMDPVRYTYHFLILVRAPWLCAGLSLTNRALCATGMEQAVWRRTRSLEGGTGQWLPGQRIRVAWPHKGTARCRRAPHP
jgi:hypothetical protein